MNIIVLDNAENPLHFVNSDLIDITETFENGLRSIKVTYNIDELVDAQNYFKQGHKIFIMGDANLTDCLYVLDTEVTQDLFKENQFSFTAEEVLVELNYAPFFTQYKLSDKSFTLSQKEGETAVKVDYNSLNYWFGDYFNIGIVQDCISTYASKIKFNGSMPLMRLLRYIEEETGNVFVTRYEKDILTNTIHRYLDFLNPVSQNKNWNTYFEYDFIPAPEGPFIKDSQGNPLPDDDDPLDDDIVLPSQRLITNLNPEHIQFRITGKNGEVLTTQNNIKLEWSATSVGLTSTSNDVAIQIAYKNNKVGIKIHKKTYKYPEDSQSIGGKNTSYLETIADDPDFIDDTALLPDRSYFEFYNTNTENVVYSRLLNPILSEAREEILDLGYNVENVEFTVDESDTYTAISPVLGKSNNGGASNSLSDSDMYKIVKAWTKLEVKKNAIIPMFVQKVSVTGTDEKKCVQRTGTAKAPNKSAEQILGTNVLSHNYYDRPLKPNDTTDGDNKSYEYWRGIAYWKAPFRKKKGSFHIEVDSKKSIEYPYIRPRKDIRTGRAIGETPKMGQVETSEENVYGIYNAVAMKLKEKKDPKFNIDVDVANYRDGLFNNYNIHDKVYVKLPGSSGLVIAKVVKTVKSLHDLSKNSITLDNYTINTKEITTDTYIDAPNLSFKYPKSKNLKATLKDSSDEDAKLGNKMLTFTVYKVENNSSTATGRIYTKKTNKKGQASLTCKFDPGNYQIEIKFPGDEEYTESTFTVKVNVTGTKKVTPTNTNTQTTGKKYKNVKRFWSKTGVSPDKKYIKAIGRSSASGEYSEYGYDFYETEFENYCPKCHRKGTLMWGIFWCGNETGDYCYFPAIGHKEGSSAEGAIFCTNGNCDGDWSIFGKEHGYDNTRLRVHKKTKKSSKKAAYNLRNGKTYYDTQKVEIKAKKVVNKQPSRKIVGNPSNKVRKLALSIVGNSTYRSALTKICCWMDKNIAYTRYCGFCRDPDEVINKGHGNCCDQTRLILSLFDAAGLSEYFELFYVRVTGHVYAQIHNKQTGRYIYIDPASDSHTCYAYVCQGYPHGSPSSTYPNKPFENSCTDC